MKHYTKLYFLLGTLFFSINQLQAAVIVDFESVTTPQFDTTITVEGFDFNFIGGGAWVIGPSPIGFGNDNGTATLLVNSSAPPVEMSKTGGGGFLLTGFDAAIGVGTGGGAIDILGTLETGGTIAHTVSIDNLYNTYLLPIGFNSPMTNIRFSPTSLIGFSLDNFTNDMIAQVPVPSAAWLFVSGLIGLIGIRKKSVKLTGKYA